MFRSSCWLFSWSRRSTDRASARTNANGVTTQVDLAAKPAADGGACERSVAIEAPPSKISTNEAKFSSAIVGTDRLMPLREDGRSSTAAILATRVAPEELQSVRIGATPTAQQLVGVSTSLDSTISMRINHSLQCDPAGSLSLDLGKTGNRPSCPKQKDLYPTGWLPLRGLGHSMPWATPRPLGTRSMGSRLCN